MAGRTAAKNWGGRSQRLVFYLGLLLASLSAVLVFVIVSNADGTGGGTSTRVPVVTASQTIPAQSRITSDMLQVSFLGEDEALQGGFSSRGQVIDRVTTQEIAAGAQIQSEMVSNSVGEGVTFVVQPGYRAISVEVREVITAGGNLEPGDYLDVLGIFVIPDVEAANHLLQQLGLPHQVAPPPVPFTSTSEDADGQLVLTVTLLQNVRLLALAQSLAETTAGGTVADESADADPNPRAATATLELTPQQARDITTADGYGILRMGARAVGDNELLDVAPTLVRIERAR
jgi:Flp pilus assembly protein CpaB